MSKANTQKRTSQTVAKLLKAVDRAARALAEAQQAERELAAMNNRDIKGAGATKTAAER
ncbi:MAG: hypothetical protein NTY19_07160 [Planctomycetota bacterium]|nr:hypothetical protein [Planctomycetota bacterium]